MAEPFDKMRDAVATAYNNLASSYKVYAGAGKPADSEATQYRVIVPLLETPQERAADEAIAKMPGAVAALLEKAASNGMSALYRPEMAAPMFYASYAGPIRVLCDYSRYMDQYIARIDVLGGCGRKEFW